MPPDSRTLADLLSSGSPILSCDDLRSAAETLVAHGRRADALRLVHEGMDSLDNDRGYLLLAELHLGAGTRDDAEQALKVLRFRQHCRPGDLQVIALLRCALRTLARRGEIAMLDRTLSWMSASFYGAGASACSCSRS